MTWKNEAKAMLLEDCVLPAEALVASLERLREFAGRYRPLFTRREQADLSEVYLQGLLSPLDRKSIEPIANEARRPRRGLQHFVGAGKWDDDAIMREFRTHVADELGDPGGVLIVDPSQFPKKGKHSVGVKRQWCGRLGKKENCQSGVFISYLSPKGHALVARELYLPKEWAEDPERRKECHVPEEVEFRTSWKIADEWLLANAHEFLHEWIVGDGELGKSGDFRTSLRRRGEHYLLQIQASRTIRVINKRYPKGKRVAGKGRRRQPPFQGVGEWAKKLPASAWRRFYVRAGEKGPIEVYGVRRRVQTRSKGRIYPHVETLVVTKTPGPKPEYHYWVSNNDEAPLEDMVCVGAKRHWVENDLQRAKGEVGFADYEVRSWVGWYHHMTLALLALFFLVLEHRRLG